MSHHNPKELKAFTCNYPTRRCLQKKSSKQKCNKVYTPELEMALPFKESMGHIPCFFSKVNFLLGLPNTEQHTPSFITHNVDLVYS